MPIATKGTLLGSSWKALKEMEEHNKDMTSNHTGLKIRKKQTKKQKRRYWCNACMYVCAR